MKYAIVAASLLSLAAAAPSDPWAPVDPPKPSSWTPVEVKPSTWEPVKPKPTTWESAKVDPTTWEPVKPKPTEWAPVEDKKCTSTKVYTTTEYGPDKEKWDYVKVVTKTSTWEDKCTSTWAPAPVKETWAPVADKKCTSTKVYTTTEYGPDKEKWDYVKVVTKTSTWEDSCPTTWAEVKTTPAATTWAEVKTTPAAATWSPASVKAASSSTVWAPVAKWTGAADKQAVGLGALAVAGVAFLL